MSDSTPEPMITIVASYHGPHEVPSMDQLLALGVRYKLGPMRSSTGLFWDDRDRQERFDAIQDAIVRIELAHGVTLERCREELDLVRNDPWCGVS